MRNGDGPPVRFPGEINWIAPLEPGAEGRTLALDFRPPIEAFDGRLQGNDGLEKAAR